ncbi:hypothetical protein CF319_g4421 [Tilletia indica]|nr:hypothetical protein CF319_g4421 [Tilletia indica]
MSSQHQQFADSHSLGIGNGDFNQNGKRASLLAGLRTGGPRPSSPAQAFGQDQYGNNGAFGPNNGFIDHAAQLKATAAVFTPRTNSGSQPGSPDHEVPGMQVHSHGVSANERMALMQQHHAQHQQIQNAQAQLAAIYGSNQGQSHQQPDFAQQHHEQLLLHQQKNAQQLIQNQLAVQQQMQLEMLRLQAMQQQQAQQQQVQAQQRALLARIHAEYERQAQIAAVNKRQEELQEQLRLQQRHQDELAQQAAVARMQQQQQQQQHGSAREQRQAAQASIQASLRNRRDEQMHAQQQMLLQQLHMFNEGGAAPYEDARLRSSPPMQNGQSGNALTHQQQHELEALMRSISLAQMDQERLEEEQFNQQQAQAQAHAHAQAQAQAQAEAEAVQQMQRTQSPPSIEANGPRFPSAQPGQEAEKSGNSSGNKQRDRMSSHADAAASWRSSLGAISGAAALRKNSNTPPAIVIDDSDSDYSVSRSSIDGLGSVRRGVSNGGRSGLANVNHSGRDTPETSEEDVASYQQKNGLSKVSSDVPAVLPSGQLNTKPTNVIRSSALAGLLGNVVASKRNRSDSAGGAASLPARPVLALNGMHTGDGRTPSPPVDSLLLGTGGPSMSSSSNSSTGNGNSGASAPRRQPKGPPMEFLPHNFASRISVRTRREAMSKLCASPRASVLSFANVGMPRATAA